MWKTLLAVSAFATVAHAHPAGLECATAAMDRFKIGAVVRSKDTHVVMKIPPSKMLTSPGLTCFSAFFFRS